MAGFWKSSGIGDFVLLAGGRGTRLWPVSKVAYKGILEFSQASLLVQNVSRAALFGAEQVIILTDHSDSLLTALAESCSGTGLRVCVQPCPSTTMFDKILYAMETASRPLCVAYGDTYAPLDFNALFAAHQEGGGNSATMTVARYRLPFGVVHLDAQGKVGAFAEKPLTEYHINIGYYIFEEHSRKDLLRARDLPAFLEGLSRERRLGAFAHPGPFETLGELGDLARTGERP